MSLLNMSFTGGVFILAVLLLRAVFQNIVSRRTFLVLWLVADALLLIPVRFRLPFSFFSLVKGPDTSAFVQAAAAQTMKAVPSRGLPWWQITWIVVGAVLLAVVLAAHGRNLWHFRKAEPVTVHPAEVPTWIRVRTLAGLPSPMAFGIFHPTILIPAEDFASPEQLRHIYLHELCHIRHLDIARRYLMLFVLAVHWFNPLVWIMYYVSSQDMEMRCDEQAIRQIGAKKPYATTLVAMETGKLQHLLDAGFSFSSTGSRLKAILKAKRLPVISLMLALLLAVSAIVFFASDAALKASAEPEPPSSMQSVDLPAPQPAPVPDPEPDTETAPEQETVSEPIEDLKSAPEPKPRDITASEVGEEEVQIPGPEPQTYVQETIALTPSPTGERGSDLHETSDNENPKTAEITIPLPSGSSISTQISVPETPEHQDTAHESEEAAWEDPDMDSFDASIEKWVREQEERRDREREAFEERMRLGIEANRGSPQTESSHGYSSAIPSVVSTPPVALHAGVSSTP